VTDEVPAGSSGGEPSEQEAAVDTAGAAPAPADAEAEGTGGAEAGDVPPEVVRLAAAVADLDGLGELPVPQHVARYDVVHGELSEALASIDEI
jgi:hypothetical protein